MKRILLVDDSATIRKILKASLLKVYEVLEAENGEVGLKVAQENEIDLFLLDVNMPVMDGIAMVKELRQLEKYATTPIVMLTTESRDNIKQTGKEVGANGWIVKPVQPGKLLEVIGKMI